MQQNTMLYELYW